MVMPYESRAGFEYGTELACGGDIVKNVIRLAELRQRRRDLRRISEANDKLLAGVIEENTDIEALYDEEVDPAIAQCVGTVAILAARAKQQVKKYESYERNLGHRLCKGLFQAFTGRLIGVRSLHGDSIISRSVYKKIGESNGYYFDTRVNETHGQIADPDSNPVLQFSSLFLHTQESNGNTKSPDEVRYIIPLLDSSSLEPCIEIEIKD